MKKNRKILVNVISIFSFLLFWQIISYFRIINPLFFSSPSKVFLSGINLFKTGILIPNLLFTLKIFFIGFFVAILFGVIIGLIIGSSKRLNLLLSPYVFFLGTLPLIAIIPLIMVWFGIGSTYKIVVVIFMTLPPIIINTIEGSRNTDKNILKMAKSFGADRFYVFKNILFYSAIPYILSGIKIASTRGVAGIVVADLFGRSVGLGYLISLFSFSYRISDLMFIVLVLFLINLSVIQIINLIKHKFIFWS